MKLIYSAQEIEHLNTYFKQNVKLLDKTTFLDKIASLIHRVPAMYYSFVSCYESGKYLQPGYLTEVNICATLAEMLNLQYKTNGLQENNLRHLYSDGKRFLKEYGGCNASDIQLIEEDGSITTIEIKEPLSLGGDFDLGITEDGKLFPKIAAGRTFPDSAQKILNEFNATDSIFNHLGHNISLSDERYLKAILQDYLDYKKINYIATYSKNNDLIYFPIEDIEQHISFKGSEIRTAGKNKVKVYTPKAFKKALLDINCSIDSKGIVMIPKNTISYRIARGSNGQVSGIKINSIFYFEIKDIIQEDECFYYADITKGKQLKQSICVHLNLF